MSVPNASPNASSGVSRSASDVPQSSGNIGLVAAISIGIGGMIGAGIFSILGVVAGVSGSAMPVSFGIGGVVALMAAYSYVKLGVRYPTAGGAVTFIVEGYGDGIKAGAVNIFQYLSYIIAIALYAHGFAAYAVTFVGIDPRVFSVGIVVAFTLVNFLGSQIMGKSEAVIVALKVAILVIFIVAAIINLDEPARLSPAKWPAVPEIIFGAGVLFVGYEGFGLITNAAANMKRPQWELPRAIYTAIVAVTVIYVLVAAGVITNMPLAELKTLGDSALAVAAKPALGQLGFTLVAIAALLSTASAVNATLFGSANVAYQMVRDGELPEGFSGQLWGRNVEGLFITSALVIMFVLLFPLGSVAMMGSAGFLLVYAAVNVGHYRIRAMTGAKGWMLVTSTILLLLLFAGLVFYIGRTEPTALAALVAIAAISLVIEIAYRKKTGRVFRRHHERAEPAVPAPA